VSRAPLPPADGQDPARESSGARRLGPPPAAGPALIPLGHIRKPHGIRGELVLAFEGEDAGLLRGTVYLAPPREHSRPETLRKDSPANPCGETGAGGICPPASALFQAQTAPGESPPVPHAVERVRVHHGELLLSLRGVDNRDKAEALRRHRLLIPRSLLPPPAEGEVYLFSLPGLRVLARDEEGAETEIGRIASADTPAGQEIWTILTPGGGEILFPAVPEFVLDLDPEAGFVRICPPPGLLDLYREK
jgi:16S rRNA processing protein RimM